MSTMTTGAISTSGNISYSGTTHSYTLSSFSTGNITTPYIIPTTIGGSNITLANYLHNNQYDFYSVEQKIKNLIPKLVPIILHHRRNGEIKNSQILTKLYSEFTSIIGFNEKDVDTNIENFKLLWEICKCNEGIWLINSRHKNNSISTICKELINLVH